MEEKILTAKEWIDVNIHLFTKGNRDNIWVDSMEEYANYKNGVLEERIKKFKEKIKDFYWLGGHEEDLLIAEYMNHFNLV